MRVLITGGAGFIGHHVIHALLTYTNAEIVSLDRLDYSGNLNRLSHSLEPFDKPTKARVKVVHHDLKAAINPHVAAHIGKVDVILHLAAGSHVDRSIEFPLEFAMDNVIGTVNILDFARTQNINRFVYFSTDEVFGPAPEGIAYSERDRYNSTNPYSASKAAAEEFAVAYENTYGIPIYITHTMNVFGERQSPEKFIPMCIRKVLNGETVTIHSNPDKTKAGSRHYIHATDVSEALLFLLTEQPKVGVDFGGAKCAKFNIVGATELDNLELAQMIARFVGRDLKYEMVDFHSSRPGHDLRYALEGGLMKSLGWEPQPIAQRLVHTVDWFVNNREWL
jgi:dTDP-glucose 4,6-dehydratase